MRAVASVLGVTGAIIPASCDGVILTAVTEGGSSRGQSEVARSSSIRHLHLEPANAAAPIEAVETIERADAVIVGPGSLFTSVLAACIVPGITQALAGTRALKIYVANLRPQVPETEGFSLEDHVEALVNHGVRPDLVLVDEYSPFARQACSLATRVVALTDRNRLVHDVTKLAHAIRDVLGTREDLFRESA